MLIAQMSESARKHVLAGWKGSYKANANTTVAQAAKAFPEFGEQMGRNLRLMRHDEAFERTITRIVMGPKTRRVRGR